MGHVGEDTFLEVKDFNAGTNCYKCLVKLTSTKHGSSLSY